ncbi:MAG: hypothetical protein AMJ91_06855 [candidate division Zixibacteria bacterium SM23_73_3]|nr:MAG: hypothetical protein AMJ91_06855 [candidate division Zixibacteria bacterium SM23_73_3]
MRESLRSIPAIILICLLSFLSAAAEEVVDSSEIGWGVGLGSLFLSQPEAKYEATSIGDIEFPCRFYGLPFRFLVWGNSSLRIDQCYGRLSMDRLGYMKMAATI